MEMVSVYVKGTSNVVPTDTYGKYTIEASPKDTLLFTFLGYLKQEIIVGKRKNIDIALKPNNDFKLTDLVVTGYGKQERRDLTGSVSSVKLDDRVGFQSVDQLLQGKAPGVYMTNSSGALGSANLLTIRGVSSIMGDNTPLYVIDGVPVYSTDRDANSLDMSGGSVPGIAMGGTQTGGGSLKYNYDLRYSFEKNPLATLNPNDIESIEILKDAFATAIYGSRGAAGVILITTKKGSRDRTQVNVGYTMSIDNPMGKLELLNGDEYSEIYNLYYKMGYPRYTNTDWVDAVTRTAVSHSTNASVSGGTGKTTYFASLSYDDNESYVINNDMQRYAARMNLNTAITDRLNMGMNMSLTKLYNNALSASSIYSLALKKAPNLPIWDDKTGDYYYGYSPNAKGDVEAFNPVAMAYINDEGLEDTRIVGNGFLEYKLGNGEWTDYEDEPLSVIRTYDATIYARVCDKAGNASEVVSLVLESDLGEYTASLMQKNKKKEYIMKEVNRLPFYLEGSPGIGKTEIVSQIAEELGIGEITLTDILKELEKPARDPREDMPAPILRSDVLDLEDLEPGMILKGTVRNVIDFGAFVDIGVHQDGLVHISRITNRYIKHPLEAVSVGDIVDVKVLEVDIPKKRISLTMRLDEK